jgi:hypothetical protein
MIDRRRNDRRDAAAHRAATNGPASAAASGTAIHE